MTEKNASPRLYRRHQRHAVYSRMRYSNQEQAFLTLQAARLSTTELVVYDALYKVTAGQIHSAANVGAI